MRLLISGTWVRPTLVASFRILFCIPEHLITCNVEHRNFEVKHYHGVHAASKPGAFRQRKHSECKGVGMLTVSASATLKKRLFRGWWPWACQNFDHGTSTWPWRYVKTLHRLFQNFILSLFFEVYKANSAFVRATSLLATSFLAFANITCLTSQWRSQPDYLVLLCTLIIQ